MSFWDALSAYDRARQLLTLAQARRDSGMIELAERIIAVFNSAMEAAI